MAELDPSIILQGQPVNVLGAMDSGFQLAQRRNEMQRQREYQNMLATNGAGILSGDQNALNALAGFDPQAAMGIQGQRLDMARTQQGMAFDAEEMQMRRETAKREAERYAATLSAEEAQAQAAQIEKAVAAGMAAQSPEQWDALVTQMGATDLVGQFGNRQAIAYTYMGVADALKASTPAEPADEYGRYVQETTARGQQPLDRIGYEQAKKGKGFSVTTADGTQIQYGGPAAGGAYPGQNASTTGTARDDGKLAMKLSENDATTLKEMQDVATAASQMESTANQMGVLAPQLGYTGVGGNLYGWVDDMIGILPGDSGARGAFRSLGTEAQLSFTEKTKGAITDREMALFSSAVPGLGQTAEGNNAIVAAMTAGAQRVQTRANFYEAWARKYGSLEGAQAVWAEYMRENPIIATSGSGISIRKEGDWTGYLNRKPAMGYTPEVIMGMTAEELSQIPIEQMTQPQLDAIEARYGNIGGQ